MKVSEALEAAARLIETTGWWDGRGLRGNRHCLMTAMQKIGWEESFWETHDYFRSYLNLSPGYPISRWNDTKSEAVVLSTLYSAAQAAKKENR